MYRRSHTYSYILALVVGAFLAVGVSVWATSIGTNISISGNLTTSGTTASSSIAYALGVGTTTPAVIFSVGGAGGNATGHGYFTGGLGVGAISTTAGQILANVSMGVATTSPAQEFSLVGDAYITSGLGVGIATTTGGSLETTGAGLIGGAFSVTGAASFDGNVTLGNAAADTLTITSNSVTYSNAGTSTIPASNANSLSVATSSAGVPLIKYNTSTYRVGVGTTTPGATLSVAGDGTALIMGGATSTLGVHSTGGTAKGGCIELEGADGASTFRLYATSSGLAIFETGTCR